MQQTGLPVKILGVAYRDKTVGIGEPGEHAGRVVSFVLYAHCHGKSHKRGRTNKFPSTNTTARPKLDTRGRVWFKLEQKMPLKY